MTVNYPFWSTRTEYTSYEAGFLFCEMEPINESSRRVFGPQPSEIPQCVMSIVREMVRDKVPYTPIYPEHNVKSGQLFKREDLIAWATKRGYRPKFLFSDAKPVTQEKLMSDRERNNMQRAIAMLVLMLAEQSNKYQFEDQPNAKKIAEAARDRAKALNWSRAGWKNIERNVHEWVESHLSEKKNAN